MTTVVPFDWPARNRRNAYEKSAKENRLAIAMNVTSGRGMPRKVTRRGCFGVGARAGSRTGNTMGAQRAGGIGESTGKNLHERDDAIREPFLDSDDEGVRAEDLNQKERENRQNHFATDVREKGHNPQDDDIRGESVRERSPGGGHMPHAGTGWKKNATAITAYTMTSNAPSYQLLRPSDTTAATTAVAKATDAISKISKSRVMTFAVSKETKTRIGATNRAT